MSEARAERHVDQLGEAAEIAWKALLAADAAFQAARLTESASLFFAALAVLVKRSTAHHEALIAYAEAQDE